MHLWLSCAYIYGSATHGALWLSFIGAVTQLHRAVKSADVGSLPRINKDFDDRKEPSAKVNAGT